LDDLNDYHYFVQVVAHGGFAAASRVLGIPKSKLSRRVAALEQRLGADRPSGAQFTQVRDGSRLGRTGKLEIVQLRLRKLTSTDCASSAGRCQQQTSTSFVIFSDMQ
jgi:hypothetical protein